MLEKLLAVMELRYVVYRYARFLSMFLHSELLVPAIKKMDIVTVDNFTCDFVVDSKSQSHHQKTML
jgi:hypothetical protein